MKHIAISFVLPFMFFCTCGTNTSKNEVLLLQGIDYTLLEKLVGECSSRVYNALMHQHLKLGTKDAFNGFISCLHQLYLMGAAVQ